MASKLISFEQAITNSDGKKRLLIGNGFSQACRKDIFSYGSLFEKADFSKLSKFAKDSFTTLNTTNFEAVIRALNDSSKLAKVYEPENKALYRQMKEDSDGLKKILVNTISNNHPLQPSELSEEEFSTCRLFLKNFETIYTLNYDLLLYWTLMHISEDSTPDDTIKCDDGFRHPDNEEGAEYVSWEMENSDKQNIHYLHGALHIFESDTELVKYTWSRTGIKLIDQINEALKNDRYPVIVAEGTSDQKISRIMKSSYLQRSLKSLRSIGGSLFVFGMALHENDEHVLKRIRKGKVSELWVAIYGDPKSKENVAMIKRAKDLATERSLKNPLKVDFYDASTTKIWNS